MSHGAIGSADGHHIGQSRKSNVPLAPETFDWIIVSVRWRAAQHRYQDRVCRRSDRCCILGVVKEPLSPVRSDAWVQIKSFAGQMSSFAGEDMIVEAVALRLVMSGETIGPDGEHGLNRDRHPPSR